MGVILLLFAGLLVGSAWAQNTDACDQETMPRLVQQIKELQKQTEELQQKSDGTRDPEREGCAAVGSGCSG